MPHADKPVVVAIGDNETLIWSMSPAERLRRIAAKLGLELASAPGAGQQVLVNLAFAFDPELLRYMANGPAQLIVDAHRVPVMARLDVKDAALAEQIGQAMQHGRALPTGLGIAEMVVDDHFTIYNHMLRKREQPFVMPLTPATRSSVERASYYAAYKGVTDILTKYLWPEAALVLTRLAARLGLTPNMVTTIGAALCVLATWLFWQG